MAVEALGGWRLDAGRFEWFRWWVLRSLPLSKSGQSKYTLSRC